MAFCFLTAWKVRREKFGVFFPPHNLHFSKDLHEGREADTPRTVWFVLKASDKLRPDALGACFAFGLVFLCWGHTGAKGWQLRSCGLPQQGECARPSPWPARSWGCVPALLEPPEWDHTPVPNSSPRAPRGSCRVLL